MKTYEIENMYGSEFKFTSTQPYTTDIDKGYSSPLGTVTYKLEYIGENHFGSYIYELYDIRFSIPYDNLTEKMVKLLFKIVWNNFEDMIYEIENVA